MHIKSRYRIHLPAAFCAAAAMATHAQASPPVPAINETFTPWTSTHSPDGLFRINGNWVGTGGDEMLTTDVKTIAGPQGNGQLVLTVPGAQTAKPYDAAEMQSLAGSTSGSVGYGYGYYETRMKVTSVGNPTNNTGVCASFFWIQAPSYGLGEIDVEINTRESWITSQNSGVVHFTIHDSAGKSQSVPVSLPFNPSKTFHRYGMLWSAGQVVFTVDGTAKLTLTDATLTLPSGGGYIMANEWTGNPTWSGMPPAYDALTTYMWMKFWPGVTTIPDPAG